MILELHRQGLKVAAIARQLGIDRKTVGKYISRGLEPPTYGPRPHRQKSTDPFLPYLRESSALSRLSIHCSPRSSRCVRTGASRSRS
jgi:transposase